MERKDLLEEFEDLMSLALFGEITEEQKEELHRIIEQDSSLKERYENYIKMQDGLKLHKTALSQSLFENQNVSSPEAFAKKLFHNRVLLLAAIIPLIVSIYLILRFQTPERPDSVSIHTLGACDSQSLTADWIRMDEKSFCDVEVIRAQGNIHFRIFPNSKVRILHLPKTNDPKESLSLFFEKGNFLLNEVIHSSGKTKLYWNGTQIELLGTKVLIEDSKNGRSLKVWNGSVSVRSGVRYILPFLLSDPKDLIQILGEENKELLNDIKTDIISDSLLETQAIDFPKDSKIFVSSDNGPNKDKKRIQTELIQIQNILKSRLKQNKTTKFTPENLNDLEKISQTLGDPQIQESKKEIQESLNMDQKEKSSVIEETPESKKEEPVRLGNKTIKLKDGSELKGNLIQYENQYILEIDGKKRVIKAEDVESISF